MHEFRKFHEIANPTEVKKMLDLVRTCCKGQNEPVTEACRLFNQQTDEGRTMNAYSDLLGTAIRSMIEVKEEKDLDSLLSIITLIEPPMDT